MKPKIICEKLKKLHEIRISSAETKMAHEIALEFSKAIIESSWFEISKSLPKVDEIVDLYDAKHRVRYMNCQLKQKIDVFWWEQRVIGENYDCRRKKYTDA